MRSCSSGCGCSAIEGDAVESARAAQAEEIRLVHADAAAFLAHEPARSYNTAFRAMTSW